MIPVYAETPIFGLPFEYTYTLCVYVTYHEIRDCMDFNPLTVTCREPNEEGYLLPVIHAYILSLK